MVSSNSKHVQLNDETAEQNLALTQSERDDRYQIRLFSLSIYSGKYCALIYGI